MIKSFSNNTAKKIFEGEDLTRKELKKLGNIRLDKAQANLQTLAVATEKELLQLPYLKYHRLKGTSRYSIDVTRNSKWRITFKWEDEDMEDVELVNVEDTH